MSSTRGHDGSIDHVLRALTDRCGGPDFPDSYEVEEALERGFAALVSLEAQLQRLDAGAVSSARDVATDSRHGVAEQIVALRSALEELRDRTSPEEPSPLALGFVFPSRNELS